MSHRRHRRHSSHPHCAWASNGWTCRYRAMEVLANGAKVRCRFCPGHQCGKNEGGLPCGVATIAGFKFCQNRGFPRPLCEIVRCVWRGREAEEVKW